VRVGKPWKAGAKKRTDNITKEESINSADEVRMNEFVPYCPTDFITADTGK
jgi:hypothetical protein